MAVIGNLIKAVLVRLAMLWDALAAIVRLAVAFIRGGGLSALTQPVNLRAVMAIARAFLPNLAISKKVVTAYDNTGTVFVTRNADVREVLDRESDFGVVYEPKMRALTGGGNFFLGMQDTPDYTRDVSNMRLAIRREDIPGLVQPLAHQTAQAAVDSAVRRIDVPQDLSLLVSWAIAARYLGLPGPDRETMTAWTTIMFWYLFIDLAGDKQVEQQALAAGKACCDYIDQVIAARKAAAAGDPQGFAGEDVISRCLTMQAAGMPGMSDVEIRNNLFGMLIGCIPTISKAAVQALDVLLDRPSDLARAQGAARAGDEAQVAQCMFEALRFNPVNPVIYRRANRETRIARGTLRSVRVKEGAMVMAANLSAMFDRFLMEAPGDFRPGRPWSSYILWGYGMHTCFGAHINQVAIPAVAMPLLQKQNLRRAPGPAGTVDTTAGGKATPFPVHWTLEFD